MTNTQINLNAPRPETLSAGEAVLFLEGTLSDYLLEEYRWNFSRELVQGLATELSRRGVTDAVIAAAFRAIEARLEALHDFGRLPADQS
jgi:hypothetical protein